MAILVAGGAGYIGSHTVYELIDAGRDVVVVDDLQTGFREAIHPKARFYELDIRNREALNNLFREERIEGVIHFAALSQVGESIMDPLKYYDNNICGTIILLESMLASGIDKIVFSSSAATYGIPKSIPIAETEKANPINPYGDTKLSMEKIVEWTDRAYGMRYIALRYFNAAGAHPSGAIGEAHNPETHLIPIILQVAGGKKDYIGIFGDDYDTKDGTCIRDYIHVSDLASAHILALDNLIGGGKSDIFNLGNGIGYTNREVVETARKVTGQSIPEKMMERRTGDPDALVAGSEKAQNKLGWEPKYADPETIISTAWKWHSKHPSGYK